MENYKDIPFWHYFDDSTIDRIKIMHKKHIYVFKGCLTVSFESYLAALKIKNPLIRVKPDGNISLELGDIGEIMNIAKAEA